MCGAIQRSNSAAFGVARPIPRPLARVAWKISGSSYDAAGNQLTANGDTLTYDAENRQTKAVESPSLGGNTEAYAYDGLGERVQKAIVGGGYTVYVNDAFGNLAAEYAPSNTWSKDYVYFGGQMVTVENAVANPCKTCYLSYDYLGTPRLVTDANANVVARHDYLPFGDEIPEGEAGRGAQYGPYTDNVNQKFTGQYRDMETLNDFFGARYYTAPLMRFLTPDPASLAAVDMTDPQTWNQYAYVRNNPLALVDPSGMDPANTAPIPVACPGCTVTVTDNDLESVCWWCWEYGIPWTYVPSQPSSESGQSGQSGPPTSAQQPPPKTGPFIAAAPPTPWYENSCVTGALSNAALHIGIDAVGLIPEAEGFTKVFENSAGYQLARAVGNSTGYRGVVATQYGMKVVAQGKGAVAMVSGAFGLGDTSVQGRISTGLTVAGFIPGLGTAAAAGSIGVDLYTMTKAIGQCQ